MEVQEWQGWPLPWPFIPYTAPCLVLPLSRVHTRMISLQFEAVVQHAFNEATFTDATFTDAMVFACHSPLPLLPHILGDMAGQRHHRL